jgi:circadian clock protein KaiB
MTRLAKSKSQPRSRSAIKSKSKSKFSFRLYVSGDAQNSAQAVVNLTAFCRAYLLERHTIEVVDVFKEPKRALADGIFLTPTLIKLAPSPAPRRIIGTLSQAQPLMQAFGVVALPA